MPRIVTSEIVVPAEMTDSDKAAFIDELYAAHASIFDGVDKEAFIHYVVESPAQHTWIQVHRGEDGRIAGYFALHIFECTLGGEAASVVRGEAGMLSAYRGANVNTRFGIERIFRYMLKNPGRPLYYLGCLVHPSSYAQIARYADRVFPSPNAALDAETTALMHELAEIFHLAPAGGPNPLVYKVGWRTRDTEADKQYWRSGVKPAARYFIEQNPTYVEGTGLLTLVPISFGGVARGTYRFAGSKAARRARAVKGALEAGMQRLGHAFGFSSEAQKPALPAR